MKTAFNNKEYAEKIINILEKNGLRRDVFHQQGLTELNVKVPAGIRLDTLLYYCFILESPGFHQKTLNIVDIEDTGQVTLAKGCAAIVEEGVHSALTLINTGSNSDVTSILVHNWKSRARVGAITSASLGEVQCS